MPERTLRSGTVRLLYVVACLLLGCQPVDRGMPPGPLLAKTATHLEGAPPFAADAGMRRWQQDLELGHLGGIVRFTWWGQPTESGSRWWRPSRWTC